MDRRPHHLLLNCAREVLSIAIRGAEKLKDRYIWTKEEIEDARSYLIYFRDTVKKENVKLYHTIFGDSGEFFELTPFARGYNARVLTFKTVDEGVIKKWVIKVGFRISPVAEFGDPASVGYFKEFQNYLDILRKAVAKIPILENLLPEPQAILWASLKIQGDGKKETTLAIQPFVNVVKPSTLKKTITREQRLSLLEELKAFKQLSSYLLKNHEVTPELIGEGNLEIVKFGDMYHLMLLDMGWVDLKKPIPLTQTIAHISAQFVIGKLENWLKNRSVAL